MFAEEVVRDVVLALVVGQLAFAGDKAECFRARLHGPQPHLGADRAVAFPRTGSDVDIRLEADGAAMATAGIGLQGHRFASTASQNRAAMSAPPKRLTSRMPVGEVTLISVM